MYYAFSVSFCVTRFFYNARACPHNGPRPSRVFCAPHVYVCAEDGHVRAEALVLSHDHTDDGVKSRGESDKSIYVFHLNLSPYMYLY